jgi:hypothetical protein
MAQFYHFDKNSSSRKSSTVSLGEAIESYLKTLKLKSKFNETYISAHWETIMGKPIASRTTKIFVTNQILYLQLSSAPLREELAKGKSLIIKNVNEAIGSILINDVVFI